MATRPSYDATIAVIEQRSANQKRVVFRGDDLARFPDDFEGGYVKLLFAEGSGDSAKVRRRSFTVRAFDRATLSLTVDFAAHAPIGPAMRWLAEAEVGDSVRLMGPGPIKRIDPSADWLLFAGDMTALPAISVHLERLPASARGHVIIQVPSPEDRQAIERPSGVELHWIVETEPSALVDAVRSLEWQPGRVSAWIATEFSAMRELRRYVRDERRVADDDLYISSYWKLDASDEEHKVAKRELRASSVA